MVENILGIASECFSGATLFQDGELSLAVNEERFTKIKLDESYPINSINWCLKESGLSPKDIDIICYGFSKGIEQGDFIASMIRRLQEYSHDPEALKTICERISTEAEVDIKRRKNFIKETSKLFPGVPIYSCSHHEAHQACAYMASPFKESLVITSDGRGDFKSLTVNTANPEGIKEVYCAFSWESLGYFYARITQLCGFKHLRHEGKILGLSAKGDPKIAKPLIDKMIGFKDGKIYSHLGDFYRPFYSNFSQRLKDEVSKFSKEDLAAATQQKIEEIVCELVSHYAHKTGLRNVCLGGGVFSNVKLNQKIKELSEIDNIFIYPNMGDDGLCAGAVYHKLLYEDKVLSSPIKTPYLGPKASNENILEMLKEKGFRIEKPENLYDTVTNLLSKNKAIGLIQGRAEFGPRALGNRTILISPDSESLCDSLNNRLNRNDFMPFAPAIASDFASRCLINYSDSQISSRHMIMTYNVTSEFKENSPAVVHVDGTVRPQIVFKEDNPFFYNLLIHWYNKTGKLSLINTSYNLHEDPIISLDKHIVDTFESNAVDCLLFPPYLAHQK